MRFRLAQLGYLLVFLAAGAGLGLSFGGTAWWLLAVALGFALWNLHQQARFEVWLQVGKQKAIPPRIGHWRPLYEHVQSIRQLGRKRKRKLAEHLRRFHQSTEALPDGVVIVDAEGSIEWLNGAAGRVLGLNTPADLGRPLVECVASEEFRAYLSGVPEEETVEFSSPLDPARVLSVRSVAFGKDQRLIISRDITRLSRLLSMRADFVANASHEMRTPLTVVLGYLEAMHERRDSLPERWWQSLHTMLQHAKRLERVVEDLLLLSQIETTEGGARAGEGHAVSVPTLLQTIEQEARSLSDGRHRIRLDCDASLDLLGEEEPLRSAFANLVHNAIRYTPQGGRIDLVWQRHDNGARLLVRDSGIGIPEEHIPRITERFYRVDVSRSREQGGTGLGLAIVKHVLQEHDARLHIESVVGKGSSFACDFPAERVIEADPESIEPLQSASV